MDLEVSLLMKPVEVLLKHQLCFLKQIHWGMEYFRTGIYVAKELECVEWLQQVSWLLELLIL